MVAAGMPVYREFAEKRIGSRLMDSVCLAAIGLLFALSLGLAAGCARLGGPQ